MGRALRWIFASLAVLFAAAGALVVHQQREISQLRTAVSAQAAQLAGNQGQVQALADRLESEQQGRLAAGQALRRTAAENSRLAEALGLDSGDLNFWRDERLRQASRRYAPQLARLNLSGEQRDGLLALLADRTDAMRDAREIALREGIASDSAEMALAVQAAAADVDADIRGLIGGAAEGLFPAAPAAAAPAAPAVTVAVYNYITPPAPAPVYAAPPDSGYAPPAYQPAPAYPVFVPYAPVLVERNFRSRPSHEAPRFAGPRPEPPRFTPNAAPRFGGVFPNRSRINTFR